MKSFLAFMGALAFACAFTCCSNDDDDDDDDEKPSSENPSDQEKGDADKDSAFVEKEFTVSLYSNPDTKYQWYWVNKNGAAFDSVSHSYKPSFVDVNGNEITNNGGTETWTFKTKAKGADSLMFCYKRPDQTIKPVKHKVPLTHGVILITPYGEELETIDTFVCHEGDSFFIVPFSENTSSDGCYWSWDNQEDAAAELVITDYVPGGGFDENGNPIPTIGFGNYCIYTFKKKASGADSLIFHRRSSTEIKDSMIIHF